MNKKLDIIWLHSNSPTTPVVNSPGKEFTWFLKSIKVNETDWLKHNNVHLFGLQKINPGALSSHPDGHLT